MRIRLKVTCECREKPVLGIVIKTNSRSIIVLTEESTQQYKVKLELLRRCMT